MVQNYKNGTRAMCGTPLLTSTTILTRGRLNLNRFIVHRTLLHGGSLVVLGSNIRHARSMTLTTRVHDHWATMVTKLDENHQL
ncbi:hypothetical protein TNCV_1714571 [Trichonephila clavipes]|nr:hypothetical protein TNCV_1714571 [Trichonephila clavipes]